MTFRKKDGLVGRKSGMTFRKKDGLVGSKTGNNLFGLLDTGKSEVVLGVAIGSSLETEDSLFGELVLGESGKRSLQGKTFGLLGQGGVVGNDGLLGISEARGVERRGDNHGQTDSEDNSLQHLENLCCFWLRSQSSSESGQSH